MTNNSSTPNPNTGPTSVITVSFRGDSEAYEALATLQEVDLQGQVKLQSAAVVERSHDGRVTEKVQIRDDSLEGTLDDGLIGLLIGVIGGPLGVLIGGATGVLIGSMFDLEDTDATESVLSEIAQAVRPGHTALLAQVTEQSPEDVDSAMRPVGGTVLRRPVDEVEAEIAAAEEAQREAKRTACKELRHAQHEKRDMQVHEKVRELKVKLSEDKPRARAAS